jgi:hypothetical protein
MIPLHSQPAMAYISDPFLAKGYDVLIAVHEESALINDYLCRNSPERTTTVDVGESMNLGTTVLRSLDSLAVMPPELVINFADTFVGDELQSGDVICFQEMEDLYRWTGFSFDESRRIRQIADKLPEAVFGDKAPVFVGLFQICQVEKFRSVLRGVLDAHNGTGTDPLFVAVANYFNELPRSSMHLQEVKDWRDFGHLDTYYETKRAFFLNKRFFNDVKVDTERGIIRKSSTNVQKLLNEVKWYLALPKALQYIGPRIFEYGFTGPNPYVEMEFYGYPALNDLYLFGNLDTSTWRRVLQGIEHAMDQMQEHRYQPKNASQLTSAMEEMYLLKTASRLEPILNDSRFARFCDRELVINGKSCIGLRECIRLLPDVADALGLFNMPYFTVIHGDFCLSNILYDRRNRFIRLIDPRGEFGSVEVYGDYRYDLAKLCHSFEGDYDFFVNDLLELEWRGGELLYSAHLDNRHLEVKRLFRQWIHGRWKDKYAEIKLIESLLFLSMVPLHADRFRSQEAFLARGLELFTSIAEQALYHHAGAVA